MVAIHPESPQLATASSDPERAESPTTAGASLSGGSLVGQVLSGTYRILAPLTEGGMAKLYRAEHQRLHRPVAVKVMADYLASNQEALLRFRREAEIVSQLDHPHIVRILDFDATQAGDPYIVMELLTGEALSERLDRVRILPLRDTIAIVTQIAGALAAAHRAGIVHRDLKPDNSFLLAMRDESIFVKLLDFGISKGSPRSLRVTRKHDVLGTPDYMAPEQARDTSVVDHRADQWSLACMAYEMLTGQLPFAAPSAIQILAKVISEPPPAMTDFVPSIPQSLQQVVSRGLCKDPEQRFASIEDFALHLALAAEPLMAEAQSLAKKESGAATPSQRTKARQNTTKMARAAIAVTQPAIAPAATAAPMPEEPPPQAPSGAKPERSPVVRSSTTKPARARLREQAMHSEVEHATKVASDRIRRNPEGQRAGFIPNSPSAPGLPDLHIEPKRQAENMLLDIERAKARGDAAAALQGVRQLLKLMSENRSGEVTHIVNVRSELLGSILLQVLGGPRQTLKFAHQPSRSDAALSPAHMLLASSIDGATTIEELLDVVPLPNLDVLGLLLDFHERGFVVAK